MKVKRVQVIFFFLILSCMASPAAPSSNITEIKVSLSDYLQIASEGRPLSGGNVSIGIPVLEIFNAKGLPVYYANSSVSILPELQTLHKKLSSLKPIANHAPLDTFFKSLKDTGVTIQEPKAAATHPYTFIFVRSDRQKSEPEMRTEKALIEFMRSEPENTIHVFKLVVSGIPAE